MKKEGVRTVLVPSSGNELEKKKPHKASKESNRPNDFFLETLTAGNISIDGAPNTSGKKRSNKKKTNSPVQSLHESLQAIKLAGQEASRSYSSVNSSQYEDVDVVRIEVESGMEEQRPSIFARMHNALFGAAVPEDKMLGNMSSTYDPVTD